MGSVQEKSNRIELQVSIMIQDSYKRDANTEHPFLVKGFREIMRQWTFSMSAALLIPKLAKPSQMREHLATRHKLKDHV